MTGRIVPIHAADPRLRALSGTPVGEPAVRRRRATRIAMRYDGKPNTVRLTP